MEFSSGIYYSWRQTQEHKMKCIARLLEPVFDDVFSGLILDIGCGFGYFEKMHEGNYIGIDNNMEMLGKSVAIFPRVLGDGDEMPFKDESFDSIICIDTIHLLDKQDFTRVLKKNGLALFSIFFNKQNFHEKKEMMQEKLSTLEIVKEFEVHGKENEFFVLAAKK